MKSLDARKVVRPLLIIVMVIIAVFTVVHLWDYYNGAPWTRDGRVRGDIIEVSSDVSGLVTDVLVQDNQTVKKGQVLFKIDTARQLLDVEQAKSDFAKANAALAQSEASLEQAKANLVKSKTTSVLADKNAARYTNLMAGAISKQEQEQVFATRDQSHADQAQVQASIVQAQATIKQQKALIEVAQSSLNLAQLNLSRSQVVAPADGTLSNFNMRAGDYVKVGEAVAAMIDRHQLYVVGYFEETKLNRIRIGDQAEIELMGDQQKLKGHVQGIASGIEDRELTSTTSLLANVNPTFTWVRLAQRVPVKIVLDQVPPNSMSFVAGRTATIRVLDNN